MAFLACCSFDQGHDLSYAPDWYIMPKDNDAIAFYGVGIGNTQEEASLSGLKNLTSRMGVTISSETTFRMEESDSIFKEKISENTSQIIKNISLNDYKITKSIRSRGKIYCEIFVDKNQFLEFQKHKLFDLSQKIGTAHKKFFDEENILLKKARVGESKLLIHELLLVNDLLRSQRHIDENNFKKNVSKYIIYDSAYDDFLSKVGFLIEFENTPEEVRDIVMLALNKKSDIRIAKNEEKNNPYLVKIKFKSNVVASNIYGENSVHIHSKVNVLNGSKDDILTKIIEIDGSSKKNKDEAIKKASINLSQIIDQKGVLDILGISW